MSRDSSSGDDLTAPMPSLHDPVAIERLRAQLRVPRDELRKFRNAFLKRSESRDRALAEIGEHLRERFAAEVELHSLDLVERCDSRVDGASKLVFRTREGFLLETVILRIDTGRTALCVSSQVGCAANCSFCATGRMGVAHDLGRSEILDQIVRANQLLAVEGRRVRNIVFMGMGEPFHNEENLYRTLETLVAPECFHHSARRILVSTVGIPAAMLRCAERFPRVHLALSLHSVDPDVRRRIIPLAKIYTLDELRETLVELNAVQEQGVMIEYLLLRGLNDRDEDLARLIEFLRGLRVHVNLIPYNPIDGADDLEATPKPRREEFARALKRAGFETTLRVSLGPDIAAACGQLIQQENRRLDAEAIPAASADRDI